MTTKNAKDAVTPRFEYDALLLGWLVPGAGHLLCRKPVRAALLFVSITSLFVLGLLMQGKLYSSAADLLDILGLAGDLGNGVLFFISKLAGLGTLPVQVTTADYGTRFVVVAGLLNFMAAVDAHNLRIGRKAA
jgi:hypothetical protein